MIRTYRLDAGKLLVEEGEAALAGAEAATWIDLLEPSAQEEQAVEAIIGANIPTREEMAEIEKSSRLYSVENAAIMTAPLIIKSLGDYPETTQVTFVLTAKQIVTVRYAEPTSFATFTASLERHPAACKTPQTLIGKLLGHAHPQTTARVAVVVWLSAGAGRDGRVDVGAVSAVPAQGLDMTVH